MSNSAKVDQKGRLKIPMTLLPTLKGPGSEFYLTSENGDSVRIYPMRVWHEVEGQLERMRLQDMNNQKLLARVKYFGRVVTMDKQGRVLIPIILRNSARMKGAVDVLDYVNHLEVWNHARLMTTLESNPITSQDEKKLNDVLSASQLSWGADWKNKEGQVQGKEREFGVHRRAHRDLRSHSSHTIRGTRIDSAERARVA